MVKADLAWARLPRTQTGDEVRPRKSTSAPSVVHEGWGEVPRYEALLSPITVHPPLPWPRRMHTPACPNGISVCLQPMNGGTVANRALP